MQTYKGHYDFIRLRFENGTIRLVRLPKDCGDVVKVSFAKKKSNLNLQLPEQPELWSGLWITNTMLFVEVITYREAYTLNSKGGRMMQCQIDRESGSLYIDRALACRLVQRKIGAETFVKGCEPLEWPILREPR